MDDRFETRLNAARSGEERDFQALLRALARDQCLTAATVVAYCQSDDPILRRAGVELATQRKEREALEAVGQLIEDPEPDVRRALAVAMADVDWWPDDALVGLLLEDRVESVRLAAVRACRKRGGLTANLLALLKDDREWAVREALADCLQEHGPRQVAVGLLSAVCEDSDTDVATASAETLEKHLNALGGYPADLERPPIDKLSVGLDRVGRAPRRRVERLHAWLQDKCRVEVDLNQLRAFGTVLTEKAHLSQVPRAFGLEDVVETIELLDDTVRLDRRALREFFESHVMGQPEAIDAAVDLVTLIKAGLTDPNKPFGVLPFVGPTGVGKTELARALAEYCFGSAGRLARFDMSEYASYEGFERLIGKTGQPGTLTAVVSEQPFSILLFDGFEKGHLNVFDLCLQIFDAGRLTDGRGKTVDFRRTIIILTWNVGAVTAQGTPIGFGHAAPADVSETQAQRDLRRAFRPEFLNRIDWIVQFLALSEETAGRIIRREVDRVLERSGIKRRNLSIGLDPSLVPLLLREGYSRQYGARPLKRVIERLILLPWARSIAAGEIRAGSLIRLLVRNGQVRVQVHQADEPDAPEAPAVSKIPADLAQRLRALQNRVAQFRELAAEQGLHALSRGVGSTDSGEPPERELVRVDVALVDPAAPAIPRNELRVEQRPLDRVAGRLMRRPRLDVQILHPASMITVRAWSDCEEQTAVERLMPLLLARINNLAGGENSGYGGEALIRRYRLGPSQLVRDARTGKKSGRLGLVFDGHIDALLIALTPSEADARE